jgi:hypothetical protein
VEVDAAGKVVAVWFRCQMLPFEQVTVGERRAREMTRAEVDVKLTGVVLAEDPPEPR